MARTPGTRSRRRLAHVASIATATLLASAVVAVPGAAAAPAAAAPPATPSAAIGARPAAPVAAAAARPKLTVTPVVTGLDIPWDVAFTPDRTMLYTQRAGKLVARLPGGASRTLFDQPANFWASGETGLMGVVVDPDFASNRTFYTCQGNKIGNGTPDVRVVRWTLNASSSAATRVADIVTGIGTSSGRHGGCRLRFDNSKTLYIGTGDAAIGTNPQDLTALNGKVLRVNRDGSPAAGNPFSSSKNANTRKIYSYGHRNVQGLSVRPGTNDMWSVEQGTYRDDEVNRPVAGGNFGYDPVTTDGKPGYNESVPMTDLTKFPKAIPAVYSTGPSTLALSGGAWITGIAWGSLNGGFVAAALKATSLRELTISAAGKLQSAQTVPELDGKYGRLREAVMGPDGALYVTTANGGGKDQILRVAPVAAPPPPPPPPVQKPGDPACRGSRADVNSPIGAVRTDTGLSAFAVFGDRSVRTVTVGRSGFTDLGGKVLYGPSAVSWDGRRIDLFAVGISHELYHKYRVGSTWSGWENLRGSATSAPAALTTGPGVLNVYVRSTDGALWVRHYDSGRGWTLWARQAGQLSGAPGVLSGTRTLVGVRGTDGFLYQIGVDSLGRRRTVFTSTGFAVCSPPAYTSSGGNPILGYLRANTSADVVVDGSATSLRGQITGSIALVPGRTAGGFAAFARGIHGPLYFYDAQNGLPGVAWRSLGGQLAP